MLFSDLQEGISHEVDISESVEDFVPVLEYLYTMNIELETETLISVLSVAHKVRKHSTTTIGVLFYQFFILIFAY